MSETPRSDAICAIEFPSAADTVYTWTEFARQLERELISSRAALSAAEQQAIVAKDKLAVANDATAIYCNRARDAERRAEAMRSDTFADLAELQYWRERNADVMTRKEFTDSLSHDDRITEIRRRARAAIASGAGESGNG